MYTYCLFAIALPCWIGIVIIEAVLLAYSLDNVKTIQSLPSNEKWQDNWLMVIRTYSVK